jgi:hypothetical protein|tara:strand:- start:664 stop:819 length:156 start_codon:yes stop_codon:yes gene_type:complete
MFDKIITTNTTKTNEMDNVVELLEEILIRLDELEEKIKVNHNAKGKGRRDV